MTMQNQEPVNAEVAPPRSHNFLSEVYAELQMTTWPTRAEALRLTYVVIGVIVVLGLYMTVLDLAIGTLFNKILHH